MKEEADQLPLMKTENPWKMVMIYSRGGNHQFRDRGERRRRGKRTTEPTKPNHALYGWKGLLKGSVLRSTP